MGKSSKSGKILKFGRIVILLTGRYAGRKAVLINSSESGDKVRKFPYCLVAGINRYPRKVTKNMSKKRIANRIKIKPFIKYVNVNHIMPTRYTIHHELELENLVAKINKHVTDSNSDFLANPDIREELRKYLKNLFETKYKTVDLNDQQDDANKKLKFFFKGLRF
eukprot:NODE_4875_length_620_cov_51.600701_g4198_i0.p1 GENE.NODE_4875_length_620_cov_51.600701_g4198_i0~~NODE_4875_length_620_cov_51.600701_g4198_i0.p1  ORF type:complete len:180 (+),score=21.32 NODE_4875_length_620_cov_51.600701_g4198_i0:48-542(+)